MDTENTRAQHERPESTDSDPAPRGATEPDRGAGQTHGAGDPSGVDSDPNPEPNQDAAVAAPSEAQTGLREGPR